MHSMCAPFPAALESFPRGTIQLSSQLSPARQQRPGTGRQRRDRRQSVQQCTAFLPWQRFLRRSPPLDQPLSAEPSALLAAQADALFAGAQSSSAPGAPCPPATSAQEEPTPQPAPVISGAGGGIFFFWQLGVIKYLSQAYDLSRVEFRGASAGALVSTLAACGVTPDAAVAAAHQLALEYQIFERPLGLAGVWGGLLRTWLDLLLPADAHTRCSGRVKLVVTELPSLRQVYVDDFSSKEELIDACMASAHIPFFLNGMPAALHKGRWYVDGSLQDFVLWRNSELLTCGGSAFVVDYSMDEELEYERLDFVKLRGVDEVRELMRQGFEYAERQEAAGVLGAHFGDFRRRQWPSWQQFQVASNLETSLARIGPSFAALRPRVEALGNVLLWARRNGDSRRTDAAADKDAAFALTAAASETAGSE